MKKSILIGLVVLVILVIAVVVFIRREKDHSVIFKAPSGKTATITVK